MAMSPESPPRPLLSVVRGEPTPAELAALTVVIAGRPRRMDGGADAGTGQTRSQWSAPVRMMRPQLRSGPGAWRGSGLPH